MSKYINPFTDFGFKRIFGEEFNEAEIAAFTPVEREAYEDSVKVYRDLKNVMDTAVEESLVRGIAIGEERGKLVVARAMAAKGMDADTIRGITGLNSW